MGFASEVLESDEEVLAELRPHVVYLLPPLFVVALAIAVAVVVAVRDPGAPLAVAWVLGAMVLLPVLWALARVLRWRAIRFLVTDTRLVYRRGVLGRDIVQLRLQRVAEVHCTQTVLGRLIGCGRLVFEVAAGDGPLVVDDVRRPRAIQRLITRTLDDADPGFGPRRHGAPPPTAPYGMAQTLAPGAPAASAGSAGLRTWSDTPPHGTLSGPGRSAGRGVAPSELTPASVPAKLVQLDELRRRGIVSEAEFAAKKAELLQRL